MMPLDVASGRLLTRVRTRARKTSDGYSGSTRSIFLWLTSLRMLMIGAYLLCPRRDLDPRLWARGNGWIVGLGAGTVVPVRLRRLLHDDGRWLYHDLRWVVIVRRRVVPPWTPPK